MALAAAITRSKNARNARTNGKQKTARAATQTLRAPNTSQTSQQWTFLTNHSHVLILLAREPNVRLRDVANEIGITERAVQRIVADLEEAAVLTRSRDGRRNRYEINTGVPLRHAVESHCNVGSLLKMVGAI